MWLIYAFNVILIILLFVFVGVMFYLNQVPFDVVEDIYVRYRTKNLRERLVKKSLKNKSKKSTKK